MNKKAIAILTGCMLTVTAFTGCAQKQETADTAQKAETTEAEATVEITQDSGEPAEEETTVGIANPWEDITEEEANEIIPKLFKVPDDAQNPGWMKCEELGDPAKNISPLVQLSFKELDMEFTSRAQQGAPEDADIAGLYVEWTVGPEDVTLAGWDMSGKTYRSINDTGYVDLITWYDNELGISYALSVADKDLDGFDIQAVAEQMYKGGDTASGNSSEAPEETEASDGFYGAYLMASDRDKIDTADEWGVMNKIVYKATLKDDKLTACGSMDYRNSRDQDSITVSSDLTHVFTVDDNTAYQMLGGEDGPEVVSKEEFAGYLESLIDTGLFLEIEVNGGVVASASISS